MILQMICFSVNVKCLTRLILIILHTTQLLNTLIPHTGSKMCKTWNRKLLSGWCFVQSNANWLWTQIWWKSVKLFPIYLDEYRKKGKVNEVVLWVILQIIREPVAIWLCGSSGSHDIGDVQFLFVFGGEGHCFVICQMMDDEMPEMVKG